MKRRQVSEREEAEALEKARVHRDELLADLQAREAARRAAARAKPPDADTTATPENPAGPEPVPTREQG